MALSQIGSDLAKPLTSFLVRVSKSPLRNDMALLISVFLVLCTTLVFYVYVFGTEKFIYGLDSGEVQKHVWAGLKINKIVFFFFFLGCTFGGNTIFVLTFSLYFDFSPYFLLLLFLVPILKTCSVLVSTVISLTEISYMANGLHC